MNWKWYNSSWLCQWLKDKQERFYQFSFLDKEKKNEIVTAELNDKYEKLVFGEEICSCYQWVIQADSISDRLHAYWMCRHKTQCWRGLV